MYFCNFFFFCFVVAICDLVHDVAAILLLTASGFFFLKYE